MVTMKKNDDANEMEYDDDEKEPDEVCFELDETHNDVEHRDEIIDNRMAQTMDNDQNMTEMSSICTSTVDNCDEDDDESSSEHELTNLGWLIDLKNLAQWPVDSNSSNRKNSSGNKQCVLHTH